MKRKIISSLIWKFLERGATQGVQFIVQIILARLLLPSDFGTIAIISVFITLSNTIIEGGLSMALVQKKNIDKVDTSSVFYLSLIVSIILYALLYIAAPSIATLYNDSSMVSLIRALGLLLLIGSFNSIQIAIISRELEFRKLFIGSLLGVVTSGIIGIYLAYNDFGVWSLIVQQLVNKLITCIVLFIVTRWKPSLVFSLSRIKELFRFGWKVLFSTIIYDISGNIRSLLIGKIYNPSVLGYYSRGLQFPELIINNVNQSVKAVMFPTFSKQQEDRMKLKNMLRRSIQVSSFILWPAMIGLAVIARPLVILVLTEKWIESVAFIQIFAIALVLKPIETANQQVVNAIGRSDISLKMNLLKRLIELTVLFISSFFGIYIIAFGAVISSVISSAINAYPNSKILDYSYIDQLKDIFPSIILSLFMGGISYSFSFMNLNLLLLVILQIIVGGVSYILLAIMIKHEAFIYIIETMKNYYKKN